MIGPVTEEVPTWPTLSAAFFAGAAVPSHRQRAAYRGRPCVHTIPQHTCNPQSFRLVYGPDMHLATFCLGEDSALKWLTILANKDI